MAFIRHMFHTFADSESIGIAGSGDLIIISFFYDVILVYLS